MNLDARIADLIALLKTGRRVTRKDLEARWERKSPTVHRTIAQARIRGHFVEPHNGCYRLDAAKSTDVGGFGFQPEELASLLGLSHWLEVLGSGVLKDRLDPIRARLEAMLQTQGLKPAEWRERIRLLPMHFRPVDPETLLCASRSALQRRQVEFEYKGTRDTRHRMRRASPQTLVRYRDNWYLDAWDHQERRLASFAVSRMRAFHVKSDPAQEILRGDLDGFFAEAYGIFSGRSRRMARVVFSGEAARFIAEERWHPKQRMSFLSGGRLRLEFPCGDVRELARDVMRYCDEVEVEGPEELRLAVEGMVRRAAGKHKAYGRENRRKTRIS